MLYLIQMNLSTLFYTYFIISFSSTIAYFSATLLFLIKNNDQLNQGHAILSGFSLFVNCIILLYCKYNERIRIFEPNHVLAMLVSLGTLPFFVAILYLIFNRFEIFLFICIIIITVSSLINLFILSKKPFEYYIL